MKRLIKIVCWTVTVMNFILAFCYILLYGYNKLYLERDDECYQLELLSEDVSFITNRKYPLPEINRAYVVTDPNRSSYDLTIEYKSGPNLRLVGYIADWNKHQGNVLKEQGDTIIESVRLRNGAHIEYRFKICK